MDILYTYQANLLKNDQPKSRRFLYEKIDWNQRLIAISGQRGTGKTTLMLQRIAEIHEISQEEVLYMTMEHPYFYNHELFETVESFYKYGGRTIFIDEIHKYKHWSREVKVIFDGFPKLKIVVSASSALDLFRGEADLSRRMISYKLPGLSFREYVNITMDKEISPISINQIKQESKKLSKTISDDILVLPTFKKYLRIGYYPFQLNLDESTFSIRINQIINTIIDSDLAYIDDYNAEASRKVKKLLGVIAESAPFKPNITKLAERISTGRRLLYSYLDHLEKAQLINYIRQSGKGISTLQKPEKIYLENTNILYSLKTIPEVGNVRESFFINQIKNADIDISSFDPVDFIIGDKEMIVEVGGKNKGFKQVQNIKNAFLVKDDIETASPQVIPLWLFGFLY